MPNNYVFINFPYDKYYEPLFLALIAGLCGLGLTPKCTLQISPREYRLKRILSLINKCRFSLHDLSRVESPIPRFNMPFEAGLAIAYSRYNKAHEWRILEAKKHRIEKTLNDLNGHEPYIHNGTINGMLCALTNIFVIKKNAPEVAELKKIYDDLTVYVKKLKKSYRNLYQETPFNRLVLAATSNAVCRRYKDRYRTTANSRSKKEKKDIKKDILKILKEMHSSKGNVFNPPIGSYEYNLAEKMVKRGLLERAPAARLGGYSLPGTSVKPY